MIEIFWWIATVELLNLIALPVTISVFRKLHDHGFSISRIVSILLITFLSWALSFIVGYPSSIAVSVMIITLASVTLIVRGGIEQADMGKIVPSYAVFIPSLIIFSLIKSFSPEIYGAEKFMDFAILNSIMRAGSFPPPDPWLSGYSLNYYYFGYLSVSILTLLSGVDSSVAFNLSVALFFALSMTASFGIGYNLTGSRKWGTMSMILVCVAGNVVGAVLLAGQAAGIKTSVYWGASRVVKNAITEFPFFSFIHGDLHPHMMSIPFQLAFISFLLTIFRGKMGMHHAVMGGLMLGFFIPLNTWEFPTYAFLLLLTSLSISRKSTIKALIIALLSILLFAPYLLHTFPSTEGVGITSQRTNLLEFLAFFLPFLAIILMRGDPKLLVVSFILAIPVGIISGIQILILLIPLITICIVRRDFASILALTACLILIGCEVFYVRDAFPYPLERMNTIFKFYMQAWVMLAVASSRMLGEMGSLRRMIAFILIGICMVYPIGATLERTHWFSGTPTLDGMDYMRRIYPGEYDAIRWIRENVKGSQTIAESWKEDGLKTDYSYASRVSSNTGLPTILGWVGHEIQWRLTQPGIEGELMERENDVDRIYTSKNKSEVMEILSKYDVKYVYVGPVERRCYGDIEFDFLEKVFDNGEVQIYSH